MAYIGKVRDYQSESDASTLHEAHKIHSDPKRRKAALKHLKAQGKSQQAAHQFYTQNQNAAEQESEND